MLAAAGYQHIRMYEIATANPNPVINYEGVTKNVTSVGFHSDMRWMYTGGEDFSAKIWDIRMRNLQCQRIFQVNTPVNCVCLHPNQVELFVGDQSGTIHLWDLRNDHNEQLLPEPNASIAHLDVDSEGTMLAAINNKGICYTWNLISGMVQSESTRLNPKIKVCKEKILRNFRSFVLMKKLKETFIKFAVKHQTKGFVLFFCFC